jgi:hypothetical protein
MSKGKLQIQCIKCKNINLKWPYEIKTLNTQRYICRKCYLDVKQNINCKCCGKDFIGNIKENRKYCSISCAAIFNNRKNKITLKKRWQLLSNDQKQKQLSGLNKVLILRKQNPSLYKLKINLKRKCKIYYKNCKICNNLFVAALDKKNYERITCGDMCRTIASNSIRTYQNGSRKPSWYFCKEQQKNVLLESSWEVEIAKLLDASNIKWIRPKPLEWFDGNKKRFYYPDFYLPEQNMYLDPKNPFCMERDKNKLNFFKNANLPLVVGDLLKVKEYILSLLS